MRPLSSDAKALLRIADWNKEKEAYKYIVREEALLIADAAAEWSEQQTIVGHHMVVGLQFGSFEHLVNTALGWENREEAIPVKSRDIQQYAVDLIAILCDRGNITKCPNCHEESDTVKVRYTEARYHDNVDKLDEVTILCEPCHRIKVSYLAEWW